MNQVQQAAVLEAFKVTASITAACRAAGVARSAHYEWLEGDPTYKDRFQKAKAEAAQLLVDEAVRRAYRGVLEPIAYQGVFTYPPLRDENGALIYDGEGRVRLSDKPVCIRKYSDGLLWKLIEARLPEEYGRKVKVEHTGNITHRLSAARERLQKLREPDSGAD